MRIIQTLLLAVTPLVALAAKDASQSKFDEYHSRSLSSTPLKLDDASYDDLTVTPRDYTVVVLLTALEARFGCQLCRDFQPEWDLIGRSWVKGDRRGENRVLYGTLDFTDGKGTFQKALLSISFMIFRSLTVPPAHVTDCPNTDVIPTDC